VLPSRSFEGTYYLAGGGPLVKRDIRNSASQAGIATQMLFNHERRIRRPALRAGRRLTQLLLHDPSFIAPRPL